MQPLAALLQKSLLGAQEKESWSQAPFQRLLEELQDLTWRFTCEWEARESEDHCAVNPMVLLLECPCLLDLAVSTARDGVM